ncbi:MAG: CCA tRNA nucleotidyltransferase [Roseovarius sp.]
MKIEGAWLKRDETQAVADALKKAGYGAFFVGGCVRNALLGAPVHDIDIATDAWPEEVMEASEAAGLKPVPTGIEHGTVTVVSGGIPHEVTTFRRDVETFGRHATVAFSTDIAEDARRRDFTMNALYANPDGTVLDPLEGIEDLKARRVRFIEDPVARIREDYLRILRFFRFHAWYGDMQAGPDAEGLAACAAELEGLGQLSRERVGAELLKLLAAPDPAPSVASMRAAGVLAAVLPGADDRFLAPLVHLEGETAPDPVRRLAALGGEGVAERLRLSKAQARQLGQLAELSASAMPPLELGYRHGMDLGRDALLLRGAYANAAPSDAEMGDLEKGARAKFPVAAADLMPAFEGPELGRKLAELEARWLRSGCTLGRDDLLG